MKDQYGNSIATQAHRMPKPKRPDIFLLVSDLMRGFVDGENETPITQKQVAELYAFFLTRSNAKPKTANDWLYKAVANQDVRHFLNFAYVENGTLCASDGHRIHWMTTDLKDGYYDSAFNPVQVVGKYPKFKRIVDIKRTKPALLIISELEIRASTRSLKPLNAYLFTHPSTGTSIALQVKYVNEAISFMTDPEISFGPTDKDNVLITDGTHNAVIMGMRL